MSKYTFLNLTKDVLEKSNCALTPLEIWEKAREFELDKKISTSGKTPWLTITASLYMDIKDNPNSEFKKEGVRPTLFGLKSKTYLQKNDIELSNDNVNYKEKDLHPVLVKYLRSNPHFLCLTKTINQSRTEGVNKKKNSNLWVYSDLIGVYYPFDDFHEIALKSFNFLNMNPCKIFSFEMKINLNFSNFKEYYFQAVSNSSWANEGYLVCDSILDDPELMDELRMLNAAHGIGIIVLNKENPEQSEIVFNARYNEKMDIYMINKLITQNKDVQIVFKNVNNCFTLVRTLDINDFDKVLGDDEYQDYSNKKFGVNY